MVPMEVKIKHAPCSQEIIDNENPICYVFLEDAK
jgi:hypothetical protein